MLSKMKSVVTRYEGNPILKPSDMPAACCAVYNSGVIKTPEGEYIMTSRFESPDKDQFIWVSRSRDGYHFVPDAEPVTFVCKPEEQAEYDANTIVKDPGIHSWYDPRICPLDGEYYITYCAGGDYACRIVIGKTRDFKTIEHVSFPLHINNRNAVLFPEKINGNYVMLHRPQNLNARESGAIWIADSPDLVYWGNCRIVAKSQAYWECTKIGPAAPPIKTPEGWLCVYHGVFPHANGMSYAGGVLLLDLENPGIVKAKARMPIIIVEELYEQVGMVPDIVFPGAVIPEGDGTVKIYYGAADYVQCVATARISDLIDACYNR